MIIYVLFFAVLNESVFNVSIPQISEQFQLLPSEVSWMITTFIVTFGIGQTIFAFSTEYRAKLFGIFISVEALAIAAGPILGGYVTSTLHWSLLFLIPLFLLPAIPLLLKLPKMNQAGCISQYSLCRPTRNQLYFVWHHDEHDFHHRCRDVCRLFPA
ncbi:hypothetical protein [Brevibacillus choshinensis]|uniref:hypothetical protein n=1 Tax=Brevibacillus choshinensis TaxID=54911 RepID=UPI002E23E267|nr:hypothetical protein [Brevibacillus choshinensis]